MIFAIAGFNTARENRFYRFYKEDIGLEYIKSKYKDKEFCVRYLEKFNIVYHRYASMVVAFVIDTEENILFVSNVISRMIQAFDHLISRVCELNLIYSLDKVYALIDGFVCDGKVIDMEPLKIASYGHY